MKKFIYAITPFCIYSFFVLLFYYVADYLVPTHNMELARYLFALFYLFHALIGVFVLGFIFGKITQKRFASKKLIHSLWLAVFTFVVIFIIGGLDGIFSQMQFRSHQTTIDDFIFGISHPDTHYFAIGTFCSFFCSCAKFLTQILIFCDTNFSVFSGSILRKPIYIFCVKINKNLYIKQHIFYNYFRYRKCNS